MTQPAIAVCLTTRNRARILPKTLDSILAQTEGDFELIIGDDASDDDTEAVCRDYAARDSRIVYHRHASKLGMPGNLNFTIQHARAPLVANLHDGDVYRPDLLAKWRAALEAAPEAAFVFNQYIYLDANGRTLSVQDQGYGSVIEKRVLTLAMLRDLASPVWGTVMGRRDCYTAMGLFNPRFGFVSDVEMWMRLNIYYPVAFVREPLIELAPREPDHPFAHPHWGIEQTLVEIHQAVIDEFYRDSPSEARQAHRDLSRMRRYRWIRFFAGCVRRRRWQRVIEARQVFSKTGDPLLKAIAEVSGPGCTLIGRLLRSSAVPASVRG